MTRSSSGTCANSSRIFAAVFVYTASSTSARMTSASSAASTFSSMRLRAMSWRFSHERRDPFRQP
ncbi:MAG: hypothetical protein IPM79_04550 [Polyangiaceae bacterium]|nr:hypothetical protein [Polyangiaceae bacterium]